MINRAYLVIALSMLCWVVATVLVQRYDSVCNAHYAYDSWVYFATFGQICAFFSNIIQALPRCLKKLYRDLSFKNIQVLECAALTIMLISGISSTLEFMAGGKFCLSLSSR